MSIHSLYLLITCLYFHEYFICKQEYVWLYFLSCHWRTQKKKHLWKPNVTRTHFDSSFYFLLSIPWTIVLPFLSPALLGSLLLSSSWYGCIRSLEQIWLLMLCHSQTVVEFLFLRLYIRSSTRFLVCLHFLPPIFVPCSCILFSFILHLWVNHELTMYLSFHLWLIDKNSFSASWLFPAASSVISYTECNHLFH